MGMPYVPINVGTTPNDGTGDSLRNAFIKCNNNFTASNGTTSSYALSSSAAGITGQITANVQEWTTTIPQITASYPVATAQGVLAYATDTAGLRIGDGQTLAGVPVGIRYWNNIHSTPTNDGRAGELAILNGGVFPVDQATGNFASTASYTSLLINTTASNTSSSWFPVILLTNGNTLNIVNNNGLNNQFYTELNISTPIIYIDFGMFGSGSDYASYGLPGVALDPFINVQVGSGGSSIGIGAQGGSAFNPLPTIIGFINGNGGNAYSNNSIGGEGGGYDGNAIIDIVCGFGGNGIFGGSGGYGGGSGAPAINISSGNGGSASGSGAVGGNGGNINSINISSGNGASVSGSGLHGGNGGNSGAIFLNGGNASASINGGAGGIINTNAAGIYSGGNINTSATTTRNGGAISSYTSTYFPSSLFSCITSSTYVNTSVESFLISSSYNTLNFYGQTVASSTGGSSIPSFIMDHIGRTISIDAMGYMTSNGTDSLNIKLYFGNTVLWSTNPFTSSLINGTGSWNYSGKFTMINQAGSINTSLTSSFIGQGEFTYFTTPSSSVIVSTPMTASFPIITSISNAIQLTSTWGSSSPLNSITLTNAICNLYN